MTIGASPVKLQQLSARQLCLLDKFNIPRCLSHWIGLLQKNLFFNLWKRQKRKNVQKMDQDSKHNRELRQSPFISICREFKCYNNNEKNPQLLKIFFILNMAPQFCQNITAVWVGPIIHSQAKTKHCLNGFSLKSSGFSQIQPQKIQLIHWNTCVFKLLIAKIILKIRIGLLEYQFVN